jgi:TM2 domain-containing membrane protein YozV
MAKFCSECGKPLSNESAKFCDNCGAKIDVTNPGDQREVRLVPTEEKNPFLATLCSFFIPGLGQTYNGETAKGVAILAGTLIGAVFFLIPGVLVWIFGLYDAYTTAKKMNNKELPLKPTKTAHLIIFLILAVLVIVAFVVLIALVISSLLATTLAHGSSLNSFPTLTPFPTFPTYSP